MKILILKMDSISEKQPNNVSPDSPSRVFSEVIWSLSGDFFDNLPEDEQIEKWRSFWKGIKQVTPEQLGIEKYLPNFASWASEGMLRDLDKEGQFSPEDQQVWETHRRIVFQMLFKLHELDTRLVPEQVRMLVNFMDVAKQYLPRSFNPLRNIIYNDRVPITLVLLAKEILQKNGATSRVYVDYSLTERAVDILYQYGWKYGFSVSSRSVSRFLSQRIRYRDMPSIEEMLREENIRDVLKNIDDYIFAGPLATTDLQEMNRQLTLGLVPEGFEGVFRDYEGQMSDSSREFIHPSEIKPAIENLFSEVHLHLKKEPLLLLSQGAKDQFILDLATYVCAKINELKPFLEANGRLGYVMAKWVLWRANSPNTFVFPGIFNERRDPDYLDYYQAVAEVIEADKPLSFEQTQRLQPLVNFIEKHLKRRD